MLPTITLTLIVKKRDGLNAWSGKTTTISAMMARIISRKMSHNLIVGVNAMNFCCQWGRLDLNVAAG
jgi:hypothetical protein